jgi:hypothetical protein
MTTLWTILQPDALTPPINQFLFLIDDNYKFLIDDTYQMLLQDTTGGGYTVVWKQQNLGQ